MTVANRPAISKDDAAAIAEHSRALRHPLRVRILDALERGGVCSPSELAVELDEPLGNVSYHVRELADFGAVELVDTKPVRGALEHFYAAAPRALDALATVRRPADEPQEFSTGS